MSWDWSAPAKTLTITDFSAAASPDYAFRFLGDDTMNAAFLALLDGTTINGLAVSAVFDGTYTDVAPVPHAGNLGADDVGNRASGRPGAAAQRGRGPASAPALSPA